MGKRIGKKIIIEGIGEYEDYGDILITEANEMNVPVDIHLIKLVGGWVLFARNYKPRLAELDKKTTTYKVRAKNREVLIALIHTYWLPLYEAAVKVLKEMKEYEDGCAGLELWKEY